MFKAVLLWSNCPSPGDSSVVKTVAYQKTIPLVFLSEFCIIYLFHVILDYSLSFNLDVT